jgi:multiple sugar transport system substrate-binding protein
LPGWWFGDTVFKTDKLKISKLSGTSAIGLLLAFCLSLSIIRGDFSCSTISKQKVPITFWNGFTGPDGRVMLEMIRDFNRANPDAEVTMQRIPWGLFYNKVMVSGLDGRGPDVFVVHASALTRMHRAGILAQMDSLFESAIPKDDFDPYVVEQTQFEGHRFCVPLDIHPQGMFLNKDMLRNAGFEGKDGKVRAPANREEFLKYAKSMMSKETYGFALTAWQNNFMSLIPQFDGHYLGADGKADLDCPGNVAALEFLGSLKSQYNLIPPPDNQLGWIGYRQKKVGMVWDGIYMLGDLLRLEGMSYMGAPIPTIGNHPGCLADSHTLCFRPGMGQKQRDVAERFVKFLSENSLRWASAGQVPARRSVRELPEFKKMQVQSAFAQQIPNMMYFPRIPVLFEMGVEVNLAVEKVIRGRANAKDALKIADENTQKAMDRDAEQHAQRDVAPKQEAVQQ